MEGMHACLHTRRLQHLTDRYVMQTPILLRIAFHDAGTWVAADQTGGPNGSVQFELSRTPNRSVVRRFGWPVVLQVRRRCKLCRLLLSLLTLLAYRPVLLAATRETSSALMVLCTLPTRVASLALSTRACLHRHGNSDACTRTRLATWQAHPHSLMFSTYAGRDADSRIFEGHCG